MKRKGEITMPKILAKTIVPDFSETEKNMIADLVRIIVHSIVEGVCHE